MDKPDRHRHARESGDRRETDEGPRTSDAERAGTEKARKHRKGHSDEDAGDAKKDKKSHKEKKEKKSKKERNESV